jgi:hypothetical protein
MHLYKLPWPGLQLWLPVRQPARLLLRTRLRLRSRLRLPGERAGPPRRPPDRASHDRAQIQMRPQRPFPGRARSAAADCDERAVRHWLRLADRWWRDVVALASQLG